MWSEVKEKANYGPTSAPRNPTEIHTVAWVYTDRRIWLHGVKGSMECPLVTCFVKRLVQ